MDNTTTAVSSSRFTFKRIAGLTLLILLAAVFFFSADSKFYSPFFMDNKWLNSPNAFDNFQWTFIDLGINSQVAAGIIARLMIGMELVLGLFLLLHIYLVRFTYKAVIGVLLFFIVYLIYVIIKHGNAGDCGCFGDKIMMSPLNGIIKNVVMIAITLLLMYIYPASPYKNQNIFLPSIAIVGLSLPFILNPINTSTAPSPAKKHVDFSLLYKYSSAPPEALLHGKHIIMFGSYYCPHCKKAAYLLQMIHHQHPDIPMYLVMAGAPEHEKQFFDESHAAAIPHFYFDHSDEFMQLVKGDAAEGGTPAIYWVNTGHLEYESTYYQLDPKYMENWLKK